MPAETVTAPRAPAADVSSSVTVPVASTDRAKLPVIALVSVADMPEKMTAPLARNPAREIAAVLAKSITPSSSIAPSGTFGPASVSSLPASIVVEPVQAALPVRVRPVPGAPSRVTSPLPVIAWPKLVCAPRSVRSIVGKETPGWVETTGPGVISNRRAITPSAS